MGKIRDFWSGNRTARTRTISRTKYGKSVLLGISDYVCIVTLNYSPGMCLVFVEFEVKT